MRPLFLLMGKYQVTVASSATSLYQIEGEAGRNLVAGLAYGHEYPHIPEMLKHAYNGLAVRIHQAYNYARDEYTYGLPNGYKELIGDVPVEDIEEIIEAEVGYPVQVHYASIEEPDDEFFAQMYSYENWGYRYDTKVLHSPPVSPKKGEQVTIYSTTWAGANSRLDIYLSVAVEEADGDWEEDEHEVERVIVNPSELPFVPDHSKLYYHVRYSPQGSTSPNRLHWLYEVGSGEYPTLDDIEREDLESPFLPVIPLREHNKNLGPEVEDGAFKKDEDGNKIKPDTELYRTSVKLCDKLDTDFDKLTLEIHSNPDINDVDHAYLIFGIDIRSESIAGKQYLYDYFEDLSVKLPGGNTITIADANYKIDLTYTSNTRIIRSGSLNEPVEITYSGDTMIAKKDFRDGTYGEVRVEGLVHKNYIYGSHNVTTSLSASSDPDNYNFIVPVNIDLLNQTKGLFNRQNLLAESFKIVFNSYDRRKLKWYERGLFKSLILIVAIVITVWSVGTFAAGISAAYSAGGISAAISAASSMILTAVAVSTAVKWLASVLPPEIALVVAVALAAVSLTGGFGDIGIDFLDAEGLLAMSGSVFEGVQMGIQNEMEELMEEMYEFMAEAEAAEEELKELWEALDTSEDWFDALIMEKTQPVLIETPTEFYTRTVHAGNIGTATLSQIETYVDKALELPELTRI